MHKMLAVYKKSSLTTYCHTVVKNESPIIYRIVAHIGRGGETKQVIYTSQPSEIDRQWAYQNVSASH